MILSAHFLTSSFRRISLVLLYCLLIDYIHHLLLDGLLLHLKSVLIPDEIRRLRVESILFHTRFEKASDITIIWILGKTKATTVMHKLSELLRLVFAKFVDGRLLLFFLDGGIFLSL